MRTLIIILFSVNFSYLFGQSINDSNLNLSKRQPFDLNYKSDYGNFKKNISYNGNNYYKFGDKVLNISIDDSTLLIIFKKGILNPDIIFGEQTTHKDRQELDTLSQFQKTIYNLVRNDSLSICCFRQVNISNKDPKTKRYTFWVFRIGIANPTEYIIQLFNNDAKHETTLEDFLENSIMTYFNKGSLII